MSTTPFLERIGLSEEEQKVYLSLLALGPLTAGEISKYTGVKPISKVKQILETFFSKNYAYNVEGLVDKAIGLYPFREIAEEAGKDGEKIDAIVAELKQYVANQVKHLDQVMREAEETVTAEKNKSSKKITDESKAAIAQVEEKQNESSTTIKTTVDSTKKKINTDTDTFLKNQTETITAFETGSNENLNVYSTKVKSSSKSTLEAMSSKIKDKNSAFLKEGTSALETSASSIKSHADKLGEDLKSDSKEKLDGTRDHLMFGLETFVNETEGNAQTLNDEIVDATNNQATFLKKTTEEAKKNRIDLNNQFKEGISNNFDKVKEDFVADFGDFETKFNSELDKIASKFKQQVDDLTAQTSTEIKGLIENANASVDDLIKKHNEEIATNVDLDNKAVEDGTTAMITKVEEQNAKALEAINSAIETLKSSTVLLKANYSGDINARVDDTITTMHSAIDTTVGQTKTNYDATKNTVVEQLTNVTNDNSASAASTATKTTTDIGNMTDTSVTELKEKVKETKGTLLTETKKTKENVKTKASTSVDEMGKVSTETLTDMSTKAKTNIRSSEETTIATIGTMANVVKDTVNKEIVTVKGDLDDFYKRFAKDALKIAKLLQDFKKQHESLQTAVKEFPKPTVETAILYSKDAIFHRLDDMLADRVKSNVTCVIPDPTDIPIKSLAKVKQQAKMTIISKIDEIQHKGIIDEIHASDTLGRTKIRKIGMQDMQGFSQYIAFDRDGGEEMLIAFKDESEQEWVGVLSTSDGFKNVVIGETLGRQALSISRELK